MKSLGLMILMLLSFNLLAQEKMTSECSKIVQERESSNKNLVSSSGEKTKEITRQ